MNTTYKTGGTAMLITIAFRNIFRNRRRTMFCVAAVGIAVFFIIFYSSLIAGMIKSMRETVQVFELGHVRAVSQQYEAEQEYSPVQYPVAEGKDLETVLKRIQAVPHVTAVFPRISAYATLQESVVKHAILWGLDINAEMKQHHFNRTERGDGLREGRWPASGANECAVGVRFAEKTGLAVGDRLPLKTVSAQFSDKLWSPVITGVFSFDYAKADREMIIVDFERLQRLLVLDGAAQQLIVFTGAPDRSLETAAEVEAILGPGNVVTAWQEQYWIVMMDMYKPMYYLMYLIFLVVACLLIVNTVTMIIHERIKEIGMMGSLGMTRAEIVKVFLFESLFLAMAGSSAGTLLGGILTGVGQFFPLRWLSLTGDIFSAMPAANTIFFEFSFGGLFRGWIMGVAVASLFTLAPSLKSAFVQPVEALRR